MIEVTETPPTGAPVVSPADSLALLGIGLVFIGGLMLWLPVGPIAAGLLLFLYGAVASRSGK